jgi:hypothetical protein
LTEAEWAASTDPDRMLQVLGARASVRKLRLFAVACCLRLHHLQPDERFRDIIETIGRFADGETSTEEIEKVRNESGVTIGFLTGFLGDLYQPSRFGEAATPIQLRQVMMRILARVRYLKGTGEKAAVPQQQCGLLREIFGPDPLLAVSIGPAWLTPTVVTLARGIYAEKAFDLMPVLGDALEDAGCNDDSILAHCRQAEGHVRGCWVVDLLLGRE